MVRRFLVSTYAFVASLTAFSQTEVTDTLQLFQPNVEIKESNYTRPDTINSLDERRVEYRYKYDAALFQNPQLRYSRISVPDISFYNGTAPIFAWKSGAVRSMGGSVLISTSYESQWYPLCNWGWGGSRDGYYLSAAFDTTKGYSYSENETSSRSSDPVEGTSDYNYQFKLTAITGIRK